MFIYMSVDVILGWLVVFCTLEEGRTRLVDSNCFMLESVSDELWGVSVFFWGRGKVYFFE